MNYDNYMELYEAVYFFNRMVSYKDNFPRIINEEAFKAFGIDNSIYLSMMRILYVNDLISYDHQGFIMDEEHYDEHQRLLETVINKKQDGHFKNMFSKAINPAHFFFEEISEAEYEIYSRYNFTITYRTGEKAAQYLDLADKKILELGGNSGGLATAFVAANRSADYTVVDMPIPCKIGREYDQANGLGIRFIESNIFELELANQVCDYVVMMNLLHDFDDDQCKTIIKNVSNYCHEDTKFVIIEDILQDAFNPKDVVMHGLRLAVECKGGRQRISTEFDELFEASEREVKKIIPLDPVHTMLLIDKK